MKTTRFITLLLMIVLLATSSCSKCGESSESAKKAAFEQKNRAAKPESDLDPSKFGTDQTVREKMISMTFLEATRRLGDVSFRQNYKLEWIAPGKDMMLTGSDEIDQLTSGDFRQKSENDSGYGIDAIFSGGKLFLKGKGGGYNEMPNDKGEAGALKEEAWGALGSYWELFEGGLLFSDAGSAMVGGRQVKKYDIALAEKKDPKAPKKALPAKDGKADAPVPADVEPKSVKGTVYIDEKANAIVHTELKGELSGGNVLVKLSFENELSPLKPGTKIVRPEVSPEPKRQKGEKDPLGRLEGRKGEGEKGSAGAPVGGKKDSDSDSEDSP
jgi:hypothetical protein